MDLYEFLHDVVKPTWRKDLSDSDRLQHALDTLVTETAEVVDIFKKGRFSPRHADDFHLALPGVRQHIAEEVGDVFYGLCALLMEIGMNHELCMDVVANKLRARYPEAFTTEEVAPEEVMSVAVSFEDANGERWQRSPRGWRKVQ